MPPVTYTETYIETVEGDLTSEWVRDLHSKTIAQHGRAGSAHMVRRYLDTIGGINRYTLSVRVKRQ